MKKTTKNHTLLFQWSCKLLKYFLLAVVGLAIAYILSVTFGASKIAVIVFSSLIYWYFRIGVFVFCFMAVGIILESLH